jgi:hypothetical protein
MTDFDPGESASIISVTDKVRPLALGAPVGAVHFLGPNAAFVGAEENIFVVAGEREPAAIAVHGGGILCANSDGKRLVTGGDDGKVVSLNAEGEVVTLATDAKRRWIDNVAQHPDGAFAWSAGKTAFVQAKDQEKSSAGSRLRPKDCGSQSRIITASRFGFPTWQANRISCHGPARIWP